MAQKQKHIDKSENIREKIRWGIAGILALLVVTSFFVAPKYGNRVIDAVNNTIALGIPRVPEQGFKLGLDLQGGASLIYQADTSDIANSERGEAVEGVRDVIERRVNAIGVGEPSVRTAMVGDSFRINVELPGVDDVHEAIEMIGATPILEFREPNNEPPRELTEEEIVAMDAYNADAETRVDALLARVTAGEEFESVAREASEDDESKNNGGYLGFVPRSLGDDPLYEWASSHGPDALTATPIETDNGWFILRRGGEQTGETYISASHILICHAGVQGCESSFTIEEARAQAQSIFDQANAENFADLAIEHSADPGNASNGGDLGTFPRGIIVPSFEEAVFSAESGQIIGPVETQFGFHIIYKTDQEETQEYELWSLFVAKQTESDILPPNNQWMNTSLSGKQLERAEVVTDYNTGAVQVSLNFDSEGADLFAEITERNLGGPVAIFLDGTSISEPTVQAVITNGQAVITGSGDIREAQLLAQRLNAGALPVPVELISQQTIGASLGAESLNASLRAGIYALIIVMFFMVVYYRLPGLLSVLALGLYMTATLSIFKVMGVTLSLAGIAGLILSIGMAVDANVLIFERLKEELKKGRSLKAAVEEGFLRAWTSIRDGNVSTLITCFLLIGFGSSFVQGFAITLAIGVAMSMFSAVVVTRVLLRFVVAWFPRRGNALFHGYQKKKED